MNCVCLPVEARRWPACTSGETPEREKQALEAQLLDSYHDAPKPLNPGIDDFWGSYMRWGKDKKRPRAIERNAIFWNQLTEFTRATRVGDISRRDIEVARVGARLWVTLNRR